MFIYLFNILTVAKSGCRIGADTIRTVTTQPAVFRALRERSSTERNFPGHALHEKGFQRQKGDGPLVSSQEQRALFFPVIKRG